MMAAVEIECPGCPAVLTIPVTAQVSGRSEAGVVQVDVLADKVEIELHALLCSGS